MELPRNLSIVSYAVNGRGLGHLSRQVAIHRWARRYATFAGVRSQHWFLTTSEADTLLFHEGFAGFKLPSKSAVAEAGIPKPSYLALAKQWIWHSVALLRPDLFIVDTFPGGSFQELLGVLDLCRHPALVLRPVRPEFAKRPSFRALAGLYERVIVPSDEASEAGLADALRLDPERLRFVGPIMRGEPFERLSRAKARALLGVPEDARCLLVSGGGGGDDGVGALFDAVEAALPEIDGEPVWLVYAAGPLFRGDPRGGPRRVWWTRPDLPRMHAAFDAALCAGGFNSVHELGFAGVPTVFLPQRKVADDQHDRVRLWVDRGAALRIDVGAVEDLGGRLQSALREVLDPQRGSEIASAARAMVPKNNARVAAREILSLSLPEGVLAQAEEELDDALMTEIRGLDVSLADLVQLAADLQGAAPIDRSAMALGPALDLLGESGDGEMSVRLLGRLARLLGRRIKSEALGPERLSEHLVEILQLPSTRGQGAALAMLLDALPGDRSLDGTAFVGRVGGLLKAAADRGHDLLAVTRMILEQPPGCEGPSLYAAIERGLQASRPGRAPEGDL